MMAPRHKSRPYVKEERGAGSPATGVFLPSTVLMFQERKADSVPLARHRPTPFALLLCFYIRQCFRTLGVLKPSLDSPQFKGFNHVVRSLSPCPSVVPGWLCSGGCFAGSKSPMNGFLE